MGEAFKCQIQNVKFREIKVPFHFPPSIVRPMRELCGASEFNFGLVAEDIRFCDDDPSPMCPANHTYVNFDMKNRSAILYLFSMWSFRTERIMINTFWLKLYRVTIHVVPNLPLIPRQRLRFSAWASYWNGTFVLRSAGGWKQREWSLWSSNCRQPGPWYGPTAAPRTTRGFPAT